MSAPSMGTPRSRVPPSVRFQKWEGLGNDFVLLEGVAMTPATAVRLCDRRRGIGADGVLVIGREPASMQVWNADGSRPEMCGNGLRCVAGYLAAAGLGTELVIATDAGPRKCEVKARGGGVEVLVGMGRAHVGDPLVWLVEGRTHRFHSVDVGNPHAVTFEPYAEGEIDALGPVVAAQGAGVNVEFCRLGEAPVPRPIARIDVTVWERGVGRTLACGTGACAVAAAACEVGLSRFGTPIRVGLPGGELIVTVAPETRELTMIGPARRVFSGEVVIS